MFSLPRIPYTHLIYRVGQNRINAPYMTVYLVVFLRKIPYVHRIYMVLANLTYICNILVYIFFLVYIYTNIYIYIYGANIYGAYM